MYVHICYQSKSRLLRNLYREFFRAGFSTLKGLNRVFTAQEAMRPSYKGYVSLMGAQMVRVEV